MVSQDETSQTLHKRYRLATALALAFTIALGIASPATADTTYNPPSGTWNGKIIYVSQACHDGNDGTPGGPCIPNMGCMSFNENTQSSTTAATTIFGVGTGANLLERGYRAVRGTGTVNQNIANSNAAGAHIHIPLHTNAPGGSWTCSNTTASNKGTLVMYVSTNGSNCSTRLVNRVGPASPGTNDVKAYRTNLGELNSTNAVACYLEAEYHTWNIGVTWIRDEVNWTYRIGWAIDEYLGYP
jgi:hypothetical protein